MFHIPVKDMPVWLQMLVELLLPLLLAAAFGSIAYRKSLLGPPPDPAQLNGGELVFKVTSGRGDAGAWLILAIGILIGGSLIMASIDKAAAPDLMKAGRVVLLVFAVGAAFFWFSNREKVRAGRNLVVSADRLKLIQNPGVVLWSLLRKDVVNIFVSYKRNVPLLAVLAVPEPTDARLPVGSLTRKLNRHSGGFDFELHESLDQPPELVAELIRKKWDLP